MHSAIPLHPDSPSPKDPVGRITSRFVVDSRTTYEMLVPYEIGLVEVLGSENNTPSSTLKCAVSSIVPV